ncbi:MAG: MarR family winged helix-turn-helix transcriptional regulator [Candidatus Limnocylindrales bacterium]|jgi:DNA-binding MarR family transcriptional regulator
MTRDKPAQTRIFDEALETSKLLVEFLHATYATRHQSPDAVGSDGAQPDASAPPPVEGVAARTPMSAHAVRAAIHVYQHGERTVGQLASGLGISYGWASRVVEELEAAHYIVRERDASDRRVVHVRLDEAAREEVERAYAWRGEAVWHALEPLSESERAAVRLFLRRVIDVMQAREPERSRALPR